MSATEEIEDVKLDELVKIYLTIRSSRERIKAAWEAEDKALEEEMKLLEQTFMVTCNESNAKSIRTNNGTVRVNPSRGSPGSCR